MLQRKEMTTLLINLISTKMLLTFPRILIINSGNSAWIQALYNAAVIILLYILTEKLYRGNKNIIQLAQMCGGKGLRIVVGTLVFLTLMINFTYVIRIFPETVKIVLLQDFRVEIIIAVLLITIAIGAYIGIEALAKINYMFMPIAGIIFVIFLLLLIPYYRFENIMPVFGNGLKNIFVNGIGTISLYSDILVLNILLPSCENSSEAKKSGRKAIYVSSLAAILILLSYCMIYPYPASKEFIIPVYQLARMIHLSSFFSRFEAVFQFAWSIVILLYASVYVYAICLVLELTLGLKYYRPLIFPVIIIGGTAALIPASILSLLQAEKSESVIVYAAAFVLPIIFGAVSRKYYGRNKIGRKGDEDEGF